MEVMLNKWRKLMRLNKAHFRGKMTEEITSMCHCFMYKQSEFFIQVSKRVAVQSICCYEKESQ